MTADLPDDRYGPVSRALARFAAGTSFEDLPPEVVEMTKLNVLDQLGIQARLSKLATSRRAADYARSAGPGPSTVVGHGVRVQPEYAAFANAVTGHGLELDDVHMPSLNHPGPMTVGAALAVGEEVDAGGAELLLAVALGYEVMGRIGRGLGQGYVYGRGFHPVGVIGPFGAAVAAAKLLGAGERAMFHAIGIAASQGGGTLEYNQTWGESTRLHAGFAASAGIRSAELALLGITGPGSPIEGKYGFARVHSDECDFDAMIAGLGSEYSLLVNSFKVRPYHGMVHNCVDVCLEALERADRTIGEDDVDSVEAIRIGLCQAGVRGIVEGDPPDRFEESLTALNFSLPVPVAHAILTQGELDAVVEFDGISPAVERLAAKVSGEFDADCEQAWLAGKLLAKVELAFSDGERIEWQTYRRGSLENPVGADDMRAKFLALAEPALGDDRARKVLEAVDGLQDLTSLEPLTGALLEARHAGTPAESQLELGG